MTRVVDASVVRLLVLGPLTIEHAGRAVHVAGTHRRRLLALLGSRAGQVVSVDAIVDALWGEHPPPSAGKTIQSHVARLRASLAVVGRDLIETTTGGYRLSADGVDVDALTFERLAVDGCRRLAAWELTAAVDVLSAAVAMWRGVPYADIPGVDFVIHERTRLAEVHATAIEDLAEAQLESGAATAVTASLERLVADNPGRERAWGLLMRALYAGGRQQDALGRLPAGAPGAGRVVRPRSRPGAAGPRAARAGAGSGADDPPARRRADRPAHGHGRVDRPGRRSGPGSPLPGRRRVEGRVNSASCSVPPESGRTRLVAQVAAAAAGDRAVVFYARGADDLAEVLGGDRARSAAPSVLDAVVECSRRRPVLIVVDDVEWASASTMEVLAVLAGAIEPLAAMLVLVADPAAGGPAVEALRRLDPTLARTVTLEPLADDEIARLVALDGIEDAGAVSAIVSVASRAPRSGPPGSGGLGRAGRR